MKKNIFWRKSSEKIKNSTDLKPSLISVTKAQVIDYDLINVVRKQKKQTIPLFMMGVIGTVSGDISNLIGKFTPKNPNRARVIKWFLIWLVFMLPLAGVITYGANTQGGGGGDNTNHDGKAIPNPNPQPSSKDRAFYIDFSTSFDYSQPVVATYPITSIDGTKGFTSKTTTINNPTFLYIALNSPERITFKIGTGTTNSYTFKLSSQLITEQERDYGQTFIGFTIYQDLSAIVRPDYNNNSNDDIYTIFAATATNRLFLPYKPFLRPKPFKNLPPRVEVKFSLDKTSGSFPSNSSFFFSYIHGDDNIKTDDHVSSIDNMRTDTIWMSTEMKKLPQGDPNDSNYTISDSDVAEKASYTLGVKDQANPANLGYNLEFDTPDPNNAHSADIFLQLNLDYKTDYIYDFVLNSVDRASTSNYYYVIKYTLYLSKDKAVWV